MDNLLAEYGSDSDESTASAANNAVNSGDKQGVKNTAMSSILEDGVDSCSSSDDEYEQVQKQSSSTNYRTDKHTAKKQWIEDAKSNSFLAINGLPSPSIAPLNAAELKSMISWATDYLSQEPPASQSNPSTSFRRQFSKFETLAASISHDRTQGWASHLSKQNEFHNPHFLQSVIDQFGIRETLGSRAVSSKTKIKPSSFH